jgi:Protein of unknown function DUF45
MLLTGFDAPIEQVMYIDKKISDAFWNEVDKVMPDYRERRAWLKRYGAGLDL